MENIENKKLDGQQVTDQNGKKITDFFNAIREILLIGFGEPKLKDAEIFDLALACNKDIIDNKSFDPQIDYDNVQVSTGTLPMAANARMRYISLIKLTVSWKNSLSGTAKNSDKAYLLYYNAAKNITLIQKGEVNREKGLMDLKINKGTMGDEVHCWLFFISEDGKLRSNSSYLMKRRSVY